jgi:energy-coupling factor transporter ATP-binding protein EcfA2
MNDSSSEIFRHGASWVRADFHLHTIKERHSSRKKLRDEWRNPDGSYREDEFVRGFVERLVSEEIKIACITNHDLLDYSEYKAIARKALKHEILVLPGMELNAHCGVDGVHALIVFDPADLNGGDSRINDFINGQFPGGKRENEVTQDDLPKCFEKLEKLDINYFVIFAHVDAENGLLKSLKGPNLQQLFKSCGDTWRKRVLGFQKARREPHVFKHILGEIPLPALVEGSDPRDSISEVGNPANGRCYLKLSDLSFAAVKFALRDHQLRVSRELPAIPRRPHVESLEIQTSGKGVFGQFFSMDLNCLIGSRGSGKSLIIEALRWVLGKQPGSGDDDYKQELLNAFLQKGGKVVLRGIDKNGDQVAITRHYLGKRDQSAPEVTVNGQASRISPDTLYPGLLYFGQKDLGIRSEQSDTQLFDQLLGPLPADITETIDLKLGRFKSAIEKYVAARQAKETDDEYAYELNALNTKLNEFKEKGIEGKLQEITLFDNDLRTFRGFLAEFSKERRATTDQFNSLLSLISKFPVLKSTENTKAAELLDATKKVFSTLQSSVLEKALGEVEAGLDAVRNLLELNKDHLQSRFGDILRSINEPDLDLDGYRKMVSRQKQLTELRAISKRGSEALASTKRDLFAAGDQWIASLRAAADHRNHQLQAINQELPEKLNLEIEAFGEKEKFDQFLDSMMKGTGFTSQAREALVNSCSSGFEIFKRWSIIKESEITPNMATKLGEVVAKRFTEFLSYAAPDSRHITFDGKRINELSLGKRAMALLVLLLSLKNYPIIIIDQPEDDLDNETIHRMIVDPLRHHKGQTQFIIATHNPNIPVLADAEQVIDCHETSKGNYEQNYGSLDKPATKDAIITIMEGGEKAFERRHEIYSQWTK